MRGLTPIQEQVLATLAGFDPPWTLTGGGALVAVHLRHRHTRDLDLFWHGREVLGALLAGVRDRLLSAGFEVRVDVDARSFARLVVTRGRASTIVDLVADIVPTIEAPQQVEVAGVCVQVDTRHEILVNKLTTLLSRSEVRDLLDVKVLLETGGDLDRALPDAARKDGGLTALSLSWVLERLPVERVAAAAGFCEHAEELERFRVDLVARLVEKSRPN